MSRYNHQRELTRSDYFVRGVFAVVSIVILLLACPRRGLLSYTTTQSLNSPWEEDAVTAPYNFDVQISEDLRQGVLDSAAHQYEPCFKRDTAIVEKQLKAFDIAFTQLAEDNDIDAKMKDAVEDILRNYYDKGIMASDVYQRYSKYGISIIHTFNDEQIGRTENFADVYDEKAAYENIMKNYESLKPVLQRLNLNQFLQVNLIYDKGKSEAQEKEINDKALNLHLTVKKGQKIVDRGQIVDERVYNELNSLAAYRNGAGRSAKDLWVQVSGQVIYIAVFVVCLVVFFSQFRSDYLEDIRYGLLVTLLCLFFPVLTYLMVRFQMGNVAFVPYCILPIFLRVFMDSRTAFMSHAICVMLCALALRYPFPFITTQLVAGLVAIFSLRQLSQRSELFRTAFLVTLTYVLLHVSIDLVGNKVDSWHDLYHNRYYLYIIINGAMILVSYLLLFATEKIFKFTSNVTLVELSNINHPLLRRLSEEAPGTFQHSLQVSNLAAEVANKVGAKSLLVRTGALFHDIGKLNGPGNFTENQGAVNPLKFLPFEVGAKTVIAHVQNGIELAKQYKLPRTLQEFIRTHHGKSKARYFYVSYKNQNPDKPCDEELFTYPGPNPYTLEQAILMMSDAVEAASRSLPEYTEESISNVVDKIVDGQVKNGYFNQCPITFENISVAKEVFKKKLKSIYHTRIAYPELKAEDAEAPEEKA